MVIEHVIGGEQPRLVPLRQFGEAVDALLVIAAIMMAHREVERCLEAPADIGEVIGPFGEKCQDHARRMGIDVLQRDEALALLRAALAHAEQAAQRAIGLAVGGVGQKRNPRFNQIQPRTDDEGQFRILRRRMCPYHAGQRVAVGHRNCRNA